LFLRRGRRRDPQGRLEQWVLSASKAGMSANLYRSKNQGPAVVVSLRPPTGTAELRKRLRRLVLYCGGSYQLGILATDAN